MPKEALLGSLYVVVACYRRCSRLIYIDLERRVRQTVDPCAMVSSAPKPLFECDSRTEIRDRNWIICYCRHVLKIVFLDIPVTR
jgi:hypothetical protein